MEGREGGEGGEGQYDVSIKRKIDVPSGPVYKEKEITRFFTLNDLDVYQARQQGLVGGLCCSDSQARRGKYQAR